MDDININNCFFHNIRETILLKTSDIFNSILSEGAILTQGSMKQKKIRFIKSMSCQGEQAVSLCFHPNNIVLYKRFYDKNKTLNEDGAFQQFILEGNTPTFILNENLINYLKIQNNNNKRMPDEIQIKGNVPLTYMIACGYSNKIDNYLYLIKKEIEVHSLTPNEIATLRTFLNIYKTNSAEILNNQYEEISIIKGLLTKYGYNVPIVDVYNGKEYPNYSKQLENIHKGISLIKEYKIDKKIYSEN